jgi:hypothetical protein
LRQSNPQGAGKRQNEYFRFEQQTSKGDFMKNKNLIRFLVRGIGAGALLLPGWGAADWKDWVTFEGEEKPWSVNVGTRVWVNEWETNSFDQLSTSEFLTNRAPFFSTSRRSSNENTQSTSTDFESTAIPYLSARYGRIFIAGSYYSQTNFDFNEKREVTVTQGFVAK